MWATTFAVVVALCTAIEQPRRRRVVVSTDPGVDDSLALLLLAASPQVELAAVAINFGSLTNMTQLANNALSVLALAGRSDVPVYVGASRPLAAPFHDLGGSRFHGEDGTGGVPPPAVPSHGINDTLSGAEAIVEACTSWRPPPILVSLAPLTNIAIALALEPKLPSLCPDLFIMAGTVTAAGNVSPLAEANSANDAEAAASVFAAGFSLRVAPLDVTMATWLDEGYLETVKVLPGNVGSWVYAMTQFYRNAYMKIGGFEGAMPLHDPSAVLLFLQPSLYTLERWPATIEASPYPSATRGLVVADRRGGPRSPPWTAANASTQFAMSVDAIGVRAALHAGLARLPVHT